MKNQTDKATAWRATECGPSLNGSQFVYKIESGPSQWAVIHAERITTGRSPGTLKTFQQIAREHNEYEALCKVAESAKDVMQPYGEAEANEHWQTKELNEALAALAALRNGGDK